SADFIGAVDLLNQPILPHEAPAVSTLLDNVGPRAGYGPTAFTTIHSQDGVIGSSFSGWHFDDRPSGDPPYNHIHEPDGADWPVVLGSDSRSIFTTAASHEPVPSHFGPDPDPVHPSDDDHVGLDHEPVPPSHDHPPALQSLAIGDVT